MDDVKVGLALGSGGARGFCHIGVIEALEENGIIPHCIAGCSLGALVGGCYASGVSIDRMKEVAKKSTMTAILDLKVSFKNNGFLKGNRAIKIVQKMIGDARIEDCKIPFCATACNINTGEKVEFTDGELLPAMRASMSIPIIFHAVEKSKNVVLVDGGIIERVPILSAKKLGADVVIAVDAIGYPENDFVRKRGFSKMFERVFKIMDWKATKENLKEADIVITPEQGDRSMMDFNKDNLKSVRFGYEATIAAMPQIKRLLNRD